MEEHERRLKRLIKDIKTSDLICIRCKARVLCGINEIFHINEK